MLLREIAKIPNNIMVPELLLSLQVKLKTNTPIA